MITFTIIIEEVRDGMTLTEIKVKDVQHTATEGGMAQLISDALSKYFLQIMKEIFSQRLKLARDLRKMSQGDLALKTGLQPSAISHFETGNRSPSFDNLKRLADALTVTTDYLLGRADQPGASGPEAGSLFLHAESLSADDFKTLDSMAKVLAEKNLSK